MTHGTEKRWTLQVHATTYGTGHGVSYERHHEHRPCCTPWTVSVHGMHHGACAVELTMSIAMAFSVEWPMGAHGIRHGSNHFHGLTYGRNVDAAMVEHHGINHGEIHGAPWNTPWVMYMPWRMPWHPP